MRDKIKFLFKDFLLIFSIFLIIILSYETGFHLCLYEVSKLTNFSLHLDDYPIVGILFLLLSLFFHLVIKVTKDKFFPSLLTKISKYGSDNIYDKINELSEKIIQKDKEITESEKKYRNLFETASDLIFILNDKAEIVDCNNKTLMVFGINNKDDIKNKPIINIIERRKSKIDKFLKIITNVINGNAEYFEIEIYNDMLKKEYILDASFNPVYIGKNIYIQCILRDITSKKKLENELKESNEKYQSLYTLLRTISDNIPDLMWAKNKLKKYLFGNKALCQKLLGCSSPEDVIGKTDLDFAIENRKKYRHDFGEMCMNSDDIVVNELQAKTFHEYGYALNNWIDLEVHKAPFFDVNNNLVGTVGVGRDITTRLKELKEISEKEERFKKLFDNASDAIIIQKSGIITDVNSKAIEMFGYDRNEFLSLNIFDITSPIQRDNKIIRSSEECYSHCNREIDCSPTIWYHKKKDGTIFCTERTCTNIIINNENYIQNIIRDITDRVNIEKKLLKSEKLYKETIDAMPSIIHVVDKNYRLILWNNNFKNLLNKYNISDNNIKGKLIFDVLKISDLNEIDVLKNQFDYVANTTNDFETNNKILLNEKSLEYNVIRFPIKNGHVTGILSIINEKKLKEKNNIVITLTEFDSLINVIHDGSILFNYETGKIKDVNNLFLEITNYNRNDIVNKSIDELKIWKTFDIYGKHKEYADIFITKDGIEKYGQFYLEKIIINNKKYILLMIRDITFDKEIIENYRNKLLGINTIFENAPVPFYYKDENGVYLNCNTEFQRFSGKSKENIIGNTVYGVFQNEEANFYFNNDNKNYEYNLNNECYYICDKKISTNEFNGIFGVIFNITNYKIKENESIRYNQLLNSIVKFIKLPIYIKDTNGNYFIVNDFFIKEFNISSNDLQITQSSIFDKETLDKIIKIDGLTILSEYYCCEHNLSKNYKNICQKFIKINNDEYILGFMY